MGDVFDNLFSIIPIVLAILWILRRASKRKSRAAQAQKPATAPVAQAESESGRSRLSEGLHILEAKAAKAIRNEVSPSQPRVEEIQYEKLETRPINVPDATPVPVQGERLLDKRDVPATGKKYSGPETSDSFDRFRKLSPLAQGMVWSIILEEPLALKEPDTSHEA